MAKFYNVPVNNIGIGTIAAQGDRSFYIKGNPDKTKKNICLSINDFYIWIDVQTNPGSPSTIFWFNDLE